MSQRNEMILDHITDDWQSVREITDSCDLPWNDATKTAAYRVLNSSLKFGIVEKRSVSGRVAHNVEWRRKRA